MSASGIPDPGRPFARASARAAASFAYLFAALLAGASAHAATIYKCIDLEGKISYQDQPCDEISLSTTIEQIPRPPPPLETPPAPVGPESPQAAWSEMTRAFQAGKIDDAMENVVPDARANFRRRFASLDAESGQKLVNYLGALDNVKLNGADAASSVSAVGTLKGPDGRISEVRFARLSGRWYVAHF